MEPAARHRMLELLGVDLRAAGEDTHPGGEQLHRYWTKDPRGLARWAHLPSGRYRALLRNLVEHMPLNKAKRVAAEWFHEVIGYWPGDDRNRVHSGKLPRGERIGPG